MKQMAEFIEILPIALVFTANVPNQWGNNSNFVLDHTQDTILCMKHGFYDENDKISENTIAFTADEPKYGEK